MIPYTLLQGALPNADPANAENVLLEVSKADSSPAARALDNLDPASLSTLPGLDMTQYALVCFGLVAVILVLGWLTKRFLAGNLRQRASLRSMKVVDVLPLGGKRQLAVVRCYDRTFVLGLGERDVSLVTELDSAEDVEGVLARPAPETSTKPVIPFGQWVQRAMRSGKPATERPSIKEAPEPPAPTPAAAAEPAPSGLGQGLLG